MPKVIFDWSGTVGKLKELLGIGLSKHKHRRGGEFCGRCYDTGIYSVPNGPDDFDWETCACGQEEIDNAEEEYGARYSGPEPDTDAYADVEKENNSGAFDKDGKFIL